MSAIPTMWKALSRQDRIFVALYLGIGAFSVAVILLAAVRGTVTPLTMLSLLPVAVGLSGAWQILRLNPDNTRRQLEREIAEIEREIAEITASTAALNAQRARLNASRTS